MFNNNKSLESTTCHHIINKKNLVCDEIMFENVAFQLIETRRKKQKEKCLQGKYDANVGCSTQI